MALEKVKSCWEAEVFSGDFTVRLSCVFCKSVAARALPTVILLLSIMANLGFPRVNYGSVPRILVGSTIARRGRNLGGKGDG